MNALNLQRKQSVKFWMPPFTGGILAFSLFIFLGETPLVRSAGLALVIVGVCVTLRRMGAILSITGGLTLSVCAAFWSQTGGGDSGPATIVIAVITASIGTLAFILWSRRLSVSIGLGILIFVGIFWSQIGTPQSLRLTSLVTAWLMYLMVDGLLITNPRPDSETPANSNQLQFHHQYGILLIFAIGMLNDPLLVLLAPAILLTLLLSQTQLPYWYWFVLIAIIGSGIWGIWDIYIDTPRILIEISGWRDATRWLDLISLVVNQYSLAGVILGVLGVARLSRWYPPLGSVTMIGYAAYSFFGLIYVGPNRETLLLPLLIIQIIWMTYAIFTIGQWATKTIAKHGIMIQHLIFAAYLLLPFLMLLNLLNNTKAF